MRKFLTAAFAVTLLAIAPTALGATGITASSSASAYENVADIKEATATVSVDQQATCLEDSTVRFDFVNASLGGKVPDTTSGHYEVEAIADEGALFPGGESTMTLSYNITGADSSLCEEVVVPDTLPVVITPEDIFFHDSCDITDDSVNVPGMPRNATYSTNVETGDTFDSVEYVVENGVYYIADSTINGVRFAKVTYVISEIQAVASEPVAGSTYMLMSGIPTWRYTFDSEPCDSNVQVPPVIEQTPPAELTPPVAEPVAPTTTVVAPAVTPIVPVVKIDRVPQFVEVATPATELASTGFDPMMTIWGAAAALLCGVGLMIARRVRAGRCQIAQ
jgi:hypothetical protein